MKALLESWNARSDGERRLLGAIGALTLLVLVVALVWLPLERERRRLAAAVPNLAASLGEMQRQAEEVKRVRTLPATTPTAAPLASVVTTGNLTRSLPGAQATLADERRVRIVASDVPYGALLESVAAAQATSGLSVQSARIEALPAPGRVRADLTLTRP